MVASGVTEKGLNGIEAEANKLAKAPKGIDGVTEGVGNLAEVCVKSAISDPRCVLHRTGWRGN